MLKHTSFFQLLIGILILILAIGGGWFLIRGDNDPVSLGLIFGAIIMLSILGISLTIQQEEKEEPTNTRGKLINE